MRTLVIGDIHGCYEELQELLVKAGIGPEDRVVAVGDVVNRGPESPQVLEFFLQRPQTLAVLGNHEWKHLQGGRSDATRITRWQCGEELYARALDWMRGLPFYLTLPEACVVHWGLVPEVRLERQPRDVLLGTAKGEEELARLLGGQAWYDVYAGPPKVVYGHHSWAAGTRRGLTYGIDGGCVYGQELTGLLLPEFELVGVPAREDHWSRLQRDWAERLQSP
jgi:serine/threonine protein phosphatase 1